MNRAALRVAVSVGLAGIACGVLEACQHRPSHVLLFERDPGSFDASKRPWLDLHPLRPVTVGVSDESHATGDAAYLFWTKSENQALTIMWQRRRGATSESAQAGSASPSGNTAGDWEPQRLFRSEYDTSSPDWDSGSQRLTFLSYHRSARGQICVWSLGAPRRLPGSSPEADRDDCFDHPGKVSQPTWGPRGQIYFLSHALPWQSDVHDSLWVLDPKSRLSRRVATYPRLGSFAVHPESGDIVAVGWQPMVEQQPFGGPELTKLPSRNNRPRLLFLLGQTTGRASSNDQASGWLPFRLNAPGFPVGPRFDSAADRLLWGQFVDDSNEDARVDGDDGSVILGSPWSAVKRELLGSNKIPGQSQHGDAHGHDSERFVDRAPLQLTLGRSNCLFPRSIAAQLFVTCAPRSATGESLLPRQLNIYTLPSMGIVPAFWSEDTLLSVRAEARDPSLQALLTNVWRYRHERSRQALRWRAELLDLVAIHWESGEMRAAREVFDVWRARIPSLGSEGERLVKLLEVIMDASALRASSRGAQSLGGSMSPTFRESLERLAEAAEAAESGGGTAKGRSGGTAGVDHFPLALARLVTSLEGNRGVGTSGTLSPRWKTLLSAVTASSGRQATAAAAAWKVPPKWEGEGASAAWTGLLRLFYLAAGSAVVRESQTQGLSLQQSADALAQLAQTLADSDSRMALSFALGSLARSRQAAQGLRGTEARAPMLLGREERSFGHPLLDELQQTQLGLLALLREARGSGLSLPEETREAYRKAYARVEGLLRPDTNRNRLVYRAHASLMAQILVDAGQPVLFGFHAANWLARTPIKSHEYSVVLDFYRSVTFSRAYDAWAAGEWNAAADIFYTALRLTRDEEAHLGFIVTSLAAGKSASDLERRYVANAEALGRSLSGEPLLRSLLALRAYQDDIKPRQTQGSARVGDPDLLDDALEALDEPQDSLPVVRDFVRGVVAHEKFRRSLDPALRKWWNPVRPLGDTSQLEEAMGAYTLTLERVAQRPVLRASVAAATAKLSLLAGSSARASGYMQAALRDLDEQAPQRGAWSLVLARALHRSGRAEAAYESLIAHERRSGVPPWPWWHEVVAFYAGESDRSREACERYALAAAEAPAVTMPMDKQLRVWGRREHEAWVCLNASDSGSLRRQSPPEPAAASAMAASRAAEPQRDYAQHGLGVLRALAKDVTDRTSIAASRTTFVARQMARNDFLDGDAMALLARVSGMLAQYEVDGVQRLSWLDVRARALQDVIKRGSRTALPERQARVYVVKACAEQALLARSLGDGERYRQGMNCATQAADALAGNERARKASGGLYLTHHDLESLRFVAILLLVDRQTPREFWQVWASSMVHVFRTSFGGTARLPEGATSSWGDELLLQYVQLGIAIKLLDEELAAAKSPAAGEMRPARRPSADVCSEYVTLPSLETLLPKEDARFFASTSTTAALELWCGGLFDPVLWRSQAADHGTEPKR